MSDVKVPSIIFDTTTSLTVGPGHDEITGTAGNNKVVGAAGGPLTTLGPADNINGGTGGENMLSITFTENSPQAVGWLSQGMDVFQARAFNSGTAHVNAIDMIGTSTLWLDNNTGNTEFDFVQNLLDIVATGGEFYSDINYAAGVAGGASQDQEILVEGTDAHFDITGGVPNLWLQANGAAHSFVDVEGDATNVMVKGNGPSLELHLEDGEYVATFDSSAFAGHTTVEADIGNDGGLATYTGSNRKDDVTLWGDGESDADINLGKAADRAYVDNTDTTELLLGGGKNFARIGYEDGVGDLTVKGGKAADDVTVYDAQSLFAGLGQGFNELDIRYVYGDVTVSTGKNADIVDADNIYGHATLNVRAGDNEVDLGYVGGNTSITGKGADDDFSVNNAYGAIVVNLGNARDGGMNQAWLDNRNASDYDPYGFHITANGGSGVDVVGMDGQNDLIANLFEGNDVVNLNNGSSSQWDELYLALGEDDDTVNLGSNYLEYNDTIMGEAGNDKITATALYYIDQTNSGGSFNNVTGVQTVETSAHSSSAFYGDSTGANAAGIMTYNLMGNITGSTYMRQMADGVNLNFWDNGGSNYFEIDSVVDGGEVNLKFTLSGSSTYNSFYTYDVGTLNVEGVDNIAGVGFPILTLGSGTSFIGDDDLTTVNLTGSAEIHMGSVSANFLDMIDGSSMSRNIELDLNNVANADLGDVQAASITVETGSGADQVWRDDTQANFDIETNAGNDTVWSGGFNDNIKLGSGNDWVEFNAGDLDDFDTVDGGADSDTLRINSGGLNEDDDIFFGISSVETWILANNGADTLSLGNIAQTSGLERIYLNGVGNPAGWGTRSSGDDSITLDDSFSNDLEVTLGYGPSSEDTVDAGASAAKLTVRARDYDIYQGDDLITGGTGDQDLLEIYDVFSYGTTLTGMTGVEFVTATRVDTSNLYLTMVQQNFDGSDTQVANQIDTITVSTRTDYTAQGDLNFDGSDATDYGKFDVTGGYGNDDITGGSGNDTITTNQGNDYVSGGAGNDNINTGGGEYSSYPGVDTVYGDAGNDVIDTGYSGDYIYGGDGMDSIDAGVGGDWIDGGANADTIDVGVDTDIDTLDYNEQTDSFGGSVDQVSNFMAGIGGDKIDVSDISYTGTEAYLGQMFRGNGDTELQSQGLTVADDGVVDVVFDKSTNTLWADINDDGTLNNNDLQIKLLGVASLDDPGTGLSANLVLDSIPA